MTLLLVSLVVLCCLVCEGGELKRQTERNEMLHQLADKPKQANSCGFCKQMVATYYAARFREPSLGFEKASQMRWPIHRSQFCQTQREDLIPQCITWYDSIMAEPNYQEKLWNVLSWGCIQKVPPPNESDSMCPRKWLGPCDPHLACNCLGQCDSNQGLSECISDCTNGQCTNCEGSVIDTNPGLMSCCAFCQTATLFAADPLTESSQSNNNNNNNNNNSNIDNGNGSREAMKPPAQEEE